MGPRFSLQRPYLCVPPHRSRSPRQSTSVTARQPSEPLSWLNAFRTRNRALLLEAAVERSFYNRLLDRTSDSRVPASWLDWLAGDWTDRPDLLVDWARQWPRTPVDIERDASALAEELLDALNDSRRGRVRNGLPVFVDWLVQDSLLSSSVSLATTVFDILLSSEPGRVERQASLVLLDESLAAGCSSKEYHEIVEALSRQLRLLGPRDASWLAQSLDLLLLFTSQDPSSRDALFAESLGVARSWTERGRSDRRRPPSLRLHGCRTRFGDAGGSDRSLQ